MKLAPHTIKSFQEPTKVAFKHTLHPAVDAVLQLLQQKGFEVRLVGGALRDFYLGQEPKDYDLTCSARLETLRQLFKDSVIIGNRHPLLQLSGAVNIEITEMPPNWRQGNHVLAINRDFTMNALILDKGIVYDYHNGLLDIKNRCIKTIVPAMRSFQIDAARILRAVRFQNKLNLKLDDQIVEHLDREALYAVNRQRMLEELRRLLQLDNLTAVNQSMLSHRLWPAVLQPRLLRGLSLNDPAEYLPNITMLLKNISAYSSNTLPATLVIAAALMALLKPNNRRILLDANIAPQQAKQVKRRLFKQLVRWGLLFHEAPQLMSILSAARRIWSEYPKSHANFKFKWEAALLILFSNQGQLTQEQINHCKKCLAKSNRQLGLAR